GKRVSGFDAGAGRTAPAIKSFEARFDRDTEAIRQSHFYFLGEEMIWRTMPKSVALIYSTKIKRPWRQDIGGREWRESGAGKSAGSAISAANIIAGDNDFLVGAALSAHGVMNRKIGKRSQADR